LYRIVIYLVSYTIWFNYILYAIYQGLLLAKNMGISDLVCYSDSLYCMNIFNGSLMRFHVIHCFDSRYKRGIGARKCYDKSPPSRRESMHRFFSQAWCLIKLWVSLSRVYSDGSFEFSSKWCIWNFLFESLTLFFLLFSFFSFVLPLYTEKK